MFMLVQLYLFFVLILILLVFNVRLKHSGFKYSLKLLRRSKYVNEEGKKGAIIATGFLFQI